MIPTLRNLLIINTLYTTYITTRCVALAYLFVIVDAVLWQLG